MKGDLAMLNQDIWNIFKKTGNIEAYLYYKEYDRVVGSREKNYDDALEMQLLQESKTNSL